MLWSRREAFVAGTSAAFLPQIARAAPEPGVPPADREMRLLVAGGSIYVRVNGDLNGTKPPIIMVHGGPGGALFHFFPVLPLAKDRAVILYDQLDSGRSDAPNNPNNWTIDRYVSEIETIRATLKLRDFHLLGHSWGGILANRYAAGRPKGLKSLVLQGAPLSDRGLKESMREVYAGLPDGAGTLLLKQAEAPHGTPAPSTPEYKAAHTLFRKRHFNRSDIMKTALPYVEKIPMDRGDAVAEAMIGNRIYGFGGKLAGMDDEPLLTRIKVPVLLLFGQYDIMTRRAEHSLLKRTQKGTLIELPDAGHMAQFDQPDAWCRAVGNFLRAHDG